MRIHLGDVPHVPAPPEAEGLRPIRGPRPWLGYLLAGLAGLVLLSALLALIVFLSFVVLPVPAAAPAPEAAPAPVEPPTPWAAIVLTLLLYIPLHELLHLAWHPRLGLSPASVLVVWPTRLRFGVYYEGCLSRTRWLLMRLAPLALLTLLPAVLLTVCPRLPLGYPLRTAVEVLMTVNGVGSGGDLVAVLLVLFQVPASARLCFRGGRAYWQPVRPLTR